MSRYPEINPEVVKAVEEAAKHRILAPTTKELARQHKISSASITRIIRAARRRLLASSLTHLSQSKK